MAPSKNCPKCGRRMDDGFIIDADQSAATKPFWYPGSPDKRWYGIKIDKKEKREVVTYRCSSCHYLESYAP